MSIWSAFRNRWAKFAAGGAIGSLLVLGSVVTTSAPASSHGGMVYPATRTYNCYLDGLAGGDAAGQGGNMLPTNPICKEALDYSSYPFYTWYGNLLPLVDGRHQETIPDGKLCGPGAQFDAFNTPSEHWPTTALESGDDITFRYAATVPHPGWWYQYITKEGWDPSQPLSWDDLELFDEVLDPPIVQGSTGPEYQWDAQLPERSGQHIIFSIWERTDSPESFYNCSDVVFGGGDPTDPGEEPTDPGEEPTDPGTGPDDPRECAVAFEVNSWNSGYTAEVTVANNTMDQVDGWDLAVTFAGDDSVQQSWSSTVSQSGKTATFTNAAWNSTIAHHGAVSFGFLANGAPSDPTEVTLNGEPCDLY